MTEIHFRAATVADVSFPDRTIELIVTPYETPTVVNDYGRSGVTEIVSRGAYDGIERRANRVRVNRDHDVHRTCGRALKFWPDRDDGLVAELRIARTELGDETLALADEEILDASAGFGLLKDDNGKVRVDALVWETRDRVRLNHLWLAHIALTPDPAYESAQVLAVRNKADGEPTRPTVATPNLDVIRAWRLEQEYTRLQH